MAGWAATTRLRGCTSPPSRANAFAPMPPKPGCGNWRLNSAGCEATDPLHIRIPLADHPVQVDSETSNSRAASPLSTQSRPSLDHAHRAGRTSGKHEDLATKLLLPGGTYHPQDTSLDPASSQGWPWLNHSVPPWRDCAPCRSHPDRVHGGCLSNELPNRLADLRPAGLRVSLVATRGPIAPVAVAAARGLKMGHVAQVMQAYPSLATGNQQIAWDAYLGGPTQGFAGRMLRWLSR